MKNLNDDNRKELSRKYGRVIKTVPFYKGGVSADIFFRKDDMQFSAHLNADRFISTEGGAVEKWVEAALKHAVELVWIPVICVLDVGSDSYNYAGCTLELHSISMDVSRFYVAAMPDGTVRSVTWDVKPEARLTSQSTPYAWVRDRSIYSGLGESKITLPLHDDTTHVLPYSEALWLGLNEILIGVDQLRKRIEGLLTQDEGLNKIISLGARSCLLLQEGKQ